MQAEMRTTVPTERTIIEFLTDGEEEERTSTRPCCSFHQSPSRSSPVPCPQQLTRSGAGPETVLAPAKIYLRGPIPIKHA